MSKSNISKRLLCLCLCFLLNCTVVYGDDMHSSNISVSSSALVFDVIVPTVLPVVVNSEGIISVPDDFKITNNSSNLVEVSKVNISGENGWEVVTYSDNFEGYPVDSKKVGVSVISAFRTGTYLSEDFFQPYTSSVSGWNKIEAEGGELNLTYNINLSSETVSRTETVANIEFIIDWVDKVPSIALSKYDLNSDNFVDSIDVTIFIAYTFDEPTLTPEQIEILDINKDGCTDSWDFFIFYDMVYGEIDWY